MEQEETGNKGALSTVARVLNAGGSVMVKSYDVTSSFFSKAANTVKYAAPDATERTKRFFLEGYKKLAIPGEITKDFFVSGYRKLFQPGEKKEIRTKIEEYDEKIKNLYLEIGKMSVSEEKPEPEVVQKLIAGVREFEKEIQRLQSRLIELDELQRADDFGKAEAKTQAKPVKKKTKVSVEYAAYSVKSVIDKALRKGDFDSDSERAIFGKIANDLLDNEMEIKTLAAIELGKMGLKAAVPVLMEAVAFDNPYLSAEIVNSLINIGDTQALRLCKEMAHGSNHRLRICCLRGLYKMGSDEEMTPYLVDALKDEHPEVRRMAATFLGWKTILDSVPGLVQSLQDKDESVRKAAVSALLNIKDAASVLPLMRVLADESIEIRQKALEAIQVVTNSSVSFDVGLSGEALSLSVEELKKWWHEERMSKVGTTIAEEALVTGYESSVSQTIVETGTEGIDTSTDTGIETVTEAAEEIQVVEQVPEEAASDSSDRAEIPPAGTLNEMSKQDIISVCKNYGIECDETYTRAELINLLHP
ncbi:MAG: HEAT repeat domain-containing protein [Nitrospirae bacterium]|nr:HEAT repeat domain-containing protein [Nitrospirota bacterium]